LFTTPLSEMSPTKSNHILSYLFSSPSPSIALLQLPSSFLSCESVFFYDSFTHSFSIHWSRKIFASVLPRTANSRGRKIIPTLPWWHQFAHLLFVLLFFFLLITNTQFCQFE
jgi:hypothetical protein